MRRLLLLVAVGSLLLGRSIDWLDRPIRNGDRFEPLGPCRVRSLGDAVDAAFD